MNRPVKTVELPAMEPALKMAATDAAARQIGAVVKAIGADH